MTIYPSYWYLQEHLCVYFCEHTKESLVDLLYKTIYNENGTINEQYSGAVVAGMRKTLQFERVFSIVAYYWVQELVTKYDLGPNNIPDPNYSCEFSEEGKVIDNQSKSAIILKYERLQKQVFAMEPSSHFQEEKQKLKEEEQKKAIQEGRVYEDVLVFLSR